jgi:4'-phosphopantetheinyl transferase
MKSLSSYAGDELHVWRISLEVPPGRLEALAATLAPEEQKRAGSFAFEHLRRRFTAGRGALREILSRYAGGAPECLRFGKRPNGKPELLDPPGWQFGFSHSRDLALCAVARRYEVGVDLEALRPVSDPLDLAERFFAPDEAETLRRLPESLRMSAFFRCWTRKEAILKATGEGLLGSLRDFSVTLVAAEPPRLLRMKDDDPMQWELFSFEPAEAFVAAVAVRARGLRLVHRVWAPASATEEPGP